MRIDAGAIKVKPGAPPVHAPLPGVSRDAAEAEPVRGEGVCGSYTGKPVLAGVLVGKITLPDVAAVPSSRGKFVSPGISLPHQAAARRVLPFGFGWQALSSPLAECLGICPGNVGHWMIPAAFELRSRAFGPPPGRAFHFAPPLKSMCLARARGNGLPELANGKRRTSQIDRLPSGSVSL